MTDVSGTVLSGENLDPLLYISSSLLIVGEYDLIEYERSLYEILYKEGFYPTGLLGIFKKNIPHPEFKLNVY